MTPMRGQHIVNGGLVSARLEKLRGRHGITQSMYYEWKEKFLKAGLEGLAYGGKTAKEKALEKELREAQRALGRATLEIELLKKRKKTRYYRAMAKETVKIVEESKERYPVALACKIMGVSRTAYYQARKQLPKSQSSIPKIDSEEEQLVTRIKAILHKHPEFEYRRV